MAESNPAPRPAPKRSSAVVVPKPLRWHQRWVATLIYGVIRGLTATLRKRIEDRSGLFDQPGGPPVIFCIWHNRLALALPIYKCFILGRSPGRRLAAIVSASGDGGIVARILEHFRVQPVRGSSSRRGPQALRELTTWARRGLDVAITPDGPRGPCYVVQEGVIALAQLTGQPIVPVSFRLGWKWSLKSWDRFQVPLPFSRWEVVFDEPVRVPREAGEEERAAILARLEARMRAITRD